MAGGVLPEGVNNLELADVVAIVVSRAETSLSGSLKGAKERYKAAAERSKVAAEALVKAQDEALSAGPVGEKVTALRVAVQALHAVKVGVVTCSCDGKVVKGHVQVWTPCGGYVQYQVPLSAPVPEGWAKLKEEHEAALKGVADAQAEVARFKAKLNDIPTLERRARAKVAERSLGATEKGKKLIELITAGLDDEIKMLAE